HVLEMSPQSVPAVAAVCVLSKVRRDDHAVPVDREVAPLEGDLALQDFRLPKTPAAIREENDDGEPGCGAEFRPVDERRREVERAVIVDVAAHDEGMVDAVQP